MPRATMLWSLILVALVAAIGVFAQDGNPLDKSMIPSDVSDQCRDLLLSIDEDEMFGECTARLIKAATMYANATQQGDVGKARQALRSTLDDTCSSNGGCERSLIRNYIATFWDKCSDELEGGNEAVKEIYDYVYMFVPFRDAVCSRDDDQYCVLGLVPQNLRAIKQLQASRANAMSLAAGASAVNQTSDVLVDQAFLFLSPASNETIMCSKCSKEVLSAYVSFEMATPYALGIERSEVLGKQSHIVSHAQDLCGESFVSDIGKMTGSSEYTEAALRAGTDALRPSLLLIVAAGLASAFVM